MVILKKGSCAGPRLLVLQLIKIESELFTHCPFITYDILEGETHCFPIG